MKQNILKLFVILICMLTAGICYSCDRYHGYGEESGDTALLLAESIVLETPGMEALETSALATCYVHICGEVNAPGVYELKEGERVFKAVELAGGFTADAASDFLNMAETVSDGMKLIVPSIEEVKLDSFSAYGSVSDDTSPGKVNINTASREQLMTLKGIGQARADDIIRHREDKGRFQTIEDIMKVPGIKEAAFERLKGDITV